MRQDFYDFHPQFKLWIAGNHKPKLRTVDEAIKRRTNLVPFSIIPKSQRDPDLPEKLKAEWPAILRWAIDGCLQWQVKGLAAPAGVQAATNDYFASQDAMVAWIDECCLREPRGWASSAELYASYQQHVTGDGEAPETSRRFADGWRATASGHSVKGSIAREDLPGSHSSIRHPEDTLADHREEEFCTVKGTHFERRRTQRRILLFQAV